MRHGFRILRKTDRGAQAMAIVMSEFKAGKIYAALAAAKREVGTVGKNGQVTEYGSYAYRRFDDVLNAVAGPLDKHGIVLAPNVTAHSERFDGKKHFVRIAMQCTFFCDDGSSMTASSIGEAFDVGDKAATKAQTVALRIILCSVLNIAYDDMQDPESGPQHQNSAVDPRVLERLKLRLRGVNEAERLKAALQYAFDCVAGQGPAGEVLSVEQLQDARQDFVEAAERCRLSDMAILRLCEQVDSAIENPLREQKADNYQSEPVRVAELELNLSEASTREKVDEQVMLMLQARRAKHITPEDMDRLCERFFGEGSPDIYRTGVIVNNGRLAETRDEITPLLQAIQADEQRRAIVPNVATIVRQYLQWRMGVISTGQTSGAK